MPDISIPFHAMPQELLPLIRESVDGMTGHLAAVTFPPYAVREVYREQIEALLVESSCCQLAFSDKKLRLPAATGGMFAERNPGLLYLEVGRRTSKGLEPSWLACRTLRMPMNPKWRKIASKLRAMTKAGADVINPDTGATVHSRNYRYTQGAKALSDVGVTILATGGGNVIRLAVPNRSVQEL